MKNWFSFFSIVIVFVSLAFTALALEVEKSQDAETYEWRIVGDFSRKFFGIDAALSGVKIANNLGMGHQYLNKEYGNQDVFEKGGKQTILLLREALQKKLPWANFAGSLNFIAQRRRYIAGEQSKRFSFVNMGRFRCQDEEVDTPLNDLRNNSGIYAERMLERYQKRMYDNDNFDIDVQNATVDHLGKTSTNERIPLCRLFLGRGRYTYVHHTQATLMPDVMKEMAIIFKQVIDSAEANLALIAKMHWWLAQTTPHMRGGGSIAEWMAITLMLYHNIEFKGWAPNVEPWSEAMLYSEEEFVAKYPEMLAK